MHADGLEYGGCQVSYVCNPPVYITDAVFVLLAYPLLPVSDLDLEYSTLYGIYSVMVQLSLFVSIVFGHNI
jgi:hypothetical protein